MGVCSTLSCDSPDAILRTHPATDEPGSRNVILLRKPSDARIGCFLDDPRSLPFSYPEVGATRDGAPPGYPLNQLRGWLGAGPEPFARAAGALRGWKMYETGRTKLCWPDVPITASTIVGVLGRHFGLWSLNACRIVYVIEEEASLLRCYGFAFGTLPGPPAGHCGPTVHAHDPEAVRDHLPAGHGCGRQCRRFPGRWVTDIRGCASTS